MAELGSPLDYYLRVFSNFEFSISGVFVLNHTVAIIGAITGLFVAGLSLLIFRSGNKDLKNQAIGMILLIEGFMAFTLGFYWIYPFSLEGLQSVIWMRPLAGITGLSRMMMMVALVSFFIETEWARRIRRVFEWKLIWILPVISFLIILYPLLTYGVDGAIGDMAHIYCAEPSAQGVGNTVFGSELGYTPVCPETFAATYPAIYVSTSTGELTLPVVLITSLPLVFVAIFMARLARNPTRVDANGYNLDEIKALRTGFLVKVGFMLGGLFLMIALSVAFGLTSPDMTLFNPDTSDNIGVMALAIGGPFSLLMNILSTLFQGVIFTYAILKHEVMGIDERLRKGFTATTFAGFGGLALLVASEAMESAIPGGGLIGGLIVGVPLIALRKPIIRVFSNISTSLMPEAHTQNELKYLEIYSIAMEDGIISSSERSMLEIQAEVFQIDEKRRKYLENWHDIEKRNVKNEGHSDLQPTVSQEWTDESGFTWRKMDDGSLMWWNGHNWVPYDN
ncbi:MAG: hypothetical protein VXX50_00010 [Candidatus Thermoplasmatota archaeon]|nr:hypothetical protein [Candidatus Thermoplasmatota archaeon]